MRTRVSSESGLCSTGSGRSDFEAIFQLDARIESSPRFEVITSPVTLTRSPKSTSDFQRFNTSSPTLSSENMAWISVPSPSRTVAKHNLPVSRLKIIRPAILSTIPVATSIAKSLCASRISLILLVRGTSTGYGSDPRSIIAARFDLRIRSCSGRSSASSTTGGFAEFVFSLIRWVSLSFSLVKNCVHELTAVRLRSNLAHGNQLFH